MNRFKIVLCQPSLPENIGAAARAMHTMGFEHLRLVAPKSWPSKEAYTLAKGGNAVLEKTQVFATLASALEDVAMAVALTARARDYIPLLPIKHALPKLFQETGDIALVFGRESSGLTNEELALCNMTMTIPANPAYPVLNLAQAVMVVCYELRQGMNLDASSYSSSSPKKAAPKAYWSLFDRLQDLLTQIELIDDPRAAMMQKLQNILWTCDLTEENIALLHAVLKRIQQKLDRHSDHTRL